MWHCRWEAQVKEIVQVKSVAFGCSFGRVASERSSRHFLWYTTPKTNGLSPDID